MFNKLAYKNEKITGKQGFTLIELLVVVAILGVIALIAIPIYVGARRDAARNEARSNLTVLYGLEHQFRNEYNAFVGGADLTALGVAPAPGGNIGFRPAGFPPNPNSLNYTYAVVVPSPAGNCAAIPAGGANSFLATATPVRGPVANDTLLQINQDNAKCGPW